MTQEEFDKLKCNRCGDCCELFTLPTPIEMADVMNWLNIKFINSTEPAAVNGRLTALWLSDIEPLDEDFSPVKGNRMKARCLRFVRIDENTGACSRYEERPSACSDFPYRVPQKDWKRCSFNVEVENPSA